MANWRAIDGWEGFYEVSDSGLVRSLPRSFVRLNRDVAQTIRKPGRILRPAARNGYSSVTLKDGTRMERLYVHRAVCLAFNGPCPEGCEATHVDGTRTNNCPANLKWATRIENMRDKQRHGTQPRGERIWIAKLTEAQARSALASPESNALLGKRFAVDRSTIRSLRSGKSWRHLRQEGALCQR